MIKVKICGITNEMDASNAVKAGADILGFIFAKSPRRISVQSAKKIISKIPPFIITVGVFVDEKKVNVKRIAKECGLDYVQLHGNESPAYCRGWDVGVIKTVKKYNENIKKYKVRAVLVDTYDPKRQGGTGRLSDWSLAKSLKMNGVPVVLSGGLSEKNIIDAIRNVRPYAVDVSSGVEKQIGKKDYKKMKDFISKVRSI